MAFKGVHPSTKQFTKSDSKDNFVFVLPGLLEVKSVMPGGGPRGSSVGRAGERDGPAQSGQERLGSRISNQLTRAEVPVHRKYSSEALKFDYVFH